MSTGQASSAPACILALVPPASRTERLKQYLSILGDGVCNNYADIQGYLTNNRQDYDQIHLDCLRSLWTFFKHGNSDTYNLMTSADSRQQYKEWIGKELPHSFVRLHQCILERFIIDTLVQKLTFKCYFQGYTFVLETLYYTALKDEFMYPDSRDMQNLMELFAADSDHRLYLDSSDDYKPLDDSFSVNFDFRSIFTISYQELLHIALELSRSTLYPFLHPENKVMVATVGLAFEPILRVIDSELYSIVGNHPSIGITCQAIQTSMVMTGCISLSNTVYGRSRFLDALVAGGIQFALILSAVGFSFGARLCLPHIFGNYVPSRELDVKEQPGTRIQGGNNDIEADAEASPTFETPVETTEIALSYTNHHMVLLSKSSVSDSPYYEHVTESMLLQIDTVLPMTANPLAKDSEEIVANIKNGFSLAEKAIPRLVDYAINFASILAILATIAPSFVPQPKGLYRKRKSNNLQASSTPVLPSPSIGSDAENLSSSGPSILVSPNIAEPSAALDTEDTNMLDLLKYIADNLSFMSKVDGFYAITCKDVKFSVKAHEPESYYKKIAAARFLDINKVITFVDPSDSKLKYYSLSDIFDKFSFRMELYIALLQTSRKFDSDMQVKRTLEEKNTLLTSNDLQAVLSQREDFKPWMKRNAPIIAGVTVATAAVVAGVIGAIVGGLSFNKKHRPPQ